MMEEGVEAEIAAAGPDEPAVDDDQLAVVIAAKAVANPDQLHKGVVGQNSQGLVDLGGASLRTGEELVAAAIDQHAHAEIRTGLRRQTRGQALADLIIVPLEHDHIN